MGSLCAKQAARPWGPDGCPRHSLAAVGNGTFLAEQLCSPTRLLRTCTWSPCCGFRHCEGAEYWSKFRFRLCYRGRPVLFPIGPTATYGTKVDHGVLANGDGTLLVYKTGYAEVPLESCDG